MGSAYFTVFYASICRTSLYCPHPACPWQGSRKESLKEHIDQGNCGARLEWEEQRMIYDPGLVLGWIREGISIDVVQMFAVDLVEERARELNKVNSWENPRIKLIPNK
jgi:hypothetical protein